MTVRGEKKTYSLHLGRRIIIIDYTVLHIDDEFFLSRFPSVYLQWNFSCLKEVYYDWLYSESKGDCSIWPNEIPQLYVTVGMMFPWNKRLQLQWLPFRVPGKSLAQPQSYWKASWETLLALFWSLFAVQLSVLSTTFTPKILQKWQT